ncbi:GWxTD domain-containing protein [candidate division KSB1 bacterium]
MKKKSRISKKIQIPLLLVFLFFLSDLSDLTAQDSIDYIQIGMSLKDSGKYDDAIKAVKKAIGKDRRNAELYFELSQIYRLKKSPASMKRAENALLDANRLDTGNVKYLNALAEVFWERYMYDTAKTVWNRTLKVDPENVDALAGHARYYHRKVNIYKDRITEAFLLDENIVKYQNYTYGSMITPGDFYAMKYNARPPITWESFLEKDVSTSNSFNNKILEIEPLERDALYRQGLLHYDTDDLDGFTETFRKLVSAYPEDKNGNLFMGLACSKTKEYDMAYNYFNKAKALMSDAEKDVFTNIGFLKIGGLKDENIRSDSSNFWYQRDPVFLTDYNERELEHYCRVAEANLRFSVYRKDIEGWKTARGKILIKYGWPKVRQLHVDLNIPGSGDIPVDGLAYQKREFWRYEDFTFVFEANYADYENKFRFAIFNGVNFHEMSELIEEEYPEYYNYEPKGKSIDFPFDAAAFRGDNGRTKLEIYYGVPFNGIVFKKENNLLLGRNTIGVFIHDKNWEKVISDINSIEMEYELSEIDTKSDDISVGLLEYQIDPGSYNLGIELDDSFSDNLGTHRNSILIEKYGFDELQISDIQLARNIEMKSRDMPVLKENLNIIPSPHRMFKTNESIYIYFEIYNLFLDGMPGKSDYTVNYSLKYMDENQLQIDDFVRKLIRNSVVDYGISTGFNISGSTRMDPQYLQIDHNLTKPGPYLFMIGVLDKLSGKMVSKEVVIYIYEDDSD